MKLIVAIVNKDDTAAVSGALRKKEYQVTKIGTTGGFLQKGNTTLLVGVEDDRVDDAVSVIKSNGHRRVVRTGPNLPAELMLGPGAVMSDGVDVTVGGATVFVLNVERYEHE